MTYKRWVTATLLGVCAQVWASFASAQTTEDTFQLGLATPLFSYNKATLEAEFAGQDAETDVSSTRWGIRDSVLLELGYGVSDLIVLGGLLQLGGSSTSVEPDGPGVAESETSDFNLVLGPKLDVVFAEGAPVRPFVGAGVAFVTANTDNEGAETSLTGFQLLARAGLRCFAARSFSIDPAFTFGWASLSGETDVGLSQVDVNAQGFSLGFWLGASGWL